MGLDTLKMFSPLATAINVIKGGKKQKTSDVAQKGLRAQQKEAKKQRRTLFETEGGAAGQEIGAGGVRQRTTLLGN